MEKRKTGNFALFSSLQGLWKSIYSSYRFYREYRKCFSYLNGKRVGKQSNNKLVIFTLCNTTILNDQSKQSGTFSPSEIRLCLADYTLSKQNLRTSINACKNAWRDENILGLWTEGRIKVKFGKCTLTSPNSIQWLGQRPIIHVFNSIICQRSINHVSNT